MKKTKSYFGNENEQNKPRKIIIQHVRGNPGRRIIRRSNLDGDNDNEDDDELSSIKAKIKLVLIVFCSSKVRIIFNREAELPENAHKVAMKELKRLKSMSPNMHEYPMLMNYLQLVSELPWNKVSSEVIDIKRAREVQIK